MVPSVDYQEMRAAFFVPSPPDAVEPAIVRFATAARRLRDAAEPIAMHAVWCEGTNTALADTYGLDFLGGYVWGRASALGDAAPGVVVAAFAVFQPDLVTALLQDARAKASWSDLVATRDRATGESLRGILGAVEVTPVVTALRRGIAAADLAGRPLFAGLALRDWPADPFTQLWRACDLLREYRGDSHVAACIAAELDAVEMNVLTELWLGMPLFSYSGTRGWSPEALQGAVGRLRRRGLLDGDDLTTEGQQARAAIEERTDAAQERVIEAIGADLDPVVEQLATWSDQLIAAGAFPPNIHKRAAG
jgi:hypothetical protein